LYRGVPSWQLPINFFRHFLWDVSISHKTQGKMNRRINYVHSLEYG